MLPEDSGTGRVGDLATAANVPRGIPARYCVGMLRIALLAITLLLTFEPASAEEGRTIYRRLDVNGTAIDYEVAYVQPVPMVAAD